VQLSSKVFSGIMPNEDVRSTVSGMCISAGVDCDSSCCDIPVAEILVIRIALAGKQIFDTLNGKFQSLSYASAHYLPLSPWIM